MFYHIGQNNSGGYYLTDAATGVGSVIVIEADSQEDATDRFDAIRAAYNANTVGGL